MSSDAKNAQSILNALSGLNDGNGVIITKAMAAKLKGMGITGPYYVQKDIPKASRRM